MNSKNWGNGVDVDDGVYCFGAVFLVDLAVGVKNA